MTTSIASPALPWREREFLSVNDIAAILLISRWLANDIMHTLPYVRVGRLLRVRTVHFEKYIKQHERGNRDA